jgi:hypothetical protein
VYSIPVLDLKIFLVLWSIICKVPVPYYLGHLTPSVHQKALSRCEIGKSVFISAVSCRDLFLRLVVVLYSDTDPYGTAFFLVTRKLY